MRVVLAVVGLAILASAGCADRTPPTAEPRPVRVAIPVAPPVQVASEAVPTSRSTVWTVRVQAR